MLRNKASIDELEKKGNNIKSINIIVVISKWDKSGKGYATNEEIENCFGIGCNDDDLVMAHICLKTMLQTLLISPKYQ